jgi:hypothetical protein
VSLVPNAIPVLVYVKQFLVMHLIHVQPTRSANLDLEHAPQGRFVRNSPVWIDVSALCIESLVPHVIPVLVHVKQFLAMRLIHVPQARCANLGREHAPQGRFVLNSSVWID